MRILNVMVNYGTYHLAHDFIESYLEYCANDDNHLVMVDNESYTGATLTIRTVFKDSLSKFRILEQDDNIMYANACNLGASQYDSEYIGIFNSDIVFLDDAISEMIEYLEAHPDVAMVGPRQIDRTNDITHSGLIMGPDKSYTGFTRLHDEHFGKRDSIVCYEDKPVDAISGSAMVIRRSFWNEIMEHPVHNKMFVNPVGAMPRQDTLYFEDVYLAMYARHLGYEVHYKGSSNIIHHWHRTILDHGEGLHYKKSKDIFLQAAKALERYEAKDD